MDNPREFARVLARAIRNEGGGAPPAAPAQTTTGPEDHSWIERWLARIDERLAVHDELFNATEHICAVYETRIVALEAKLEELQKKPAARAVEHVRDSHGAVIRSLLIEGDA